MASSYKLADRRELMGSNCWYVESIDLSRCGTVDLVNDYINEYTHTDYTLSIFDMVTNQTVEILCSTDEMADIVQYVSDVEHSVVNWISANNMTDSYIVGMEFTRGRIEAGTYVAKAGKLIRN